MVFTSSSNLVRTFSDLRQRNGARYAEHEVIGKKPKLEFVGPGLEEISFKVQLMRELGVDPDKELKVLQEMRDKGEAALLIFGETKSVSSGLPNYLPKKGLEAIPALPRG